MDVSNVLNFRSILKWAFFLVTFTIIGSTTFVWSSAIDEKFTLGNAYGFTIGSPKAEVHKILSTSFYLTKTMKGRDIDRMSLFVKNENNPLLVKSKSDREDFALFVDKNKWILYLESSYYFDDLTLKFCDDELCEIIRTRFYLELP